MFSFDVLRLSEQEKKDFINFNNASNYYVDVREDDYIEDLHFDLFEREDEFFYIAVNFFDENQDINPFNYINDTIRDIYERYKNTTYEEDEYNICFDDLFNEIEKFIICNNLKSYHDYFYFFVKHYDDYKDDEMYLYFAKIIYQFYLDHEQRRYIRAKYANKEVIEINLMESQDYNMLLELKECDICYINNCLYSHACVNNKCKYVLCKDCKKQLQKRECPYCRTLQYH